MNRFGSEELLRFLEAVDAALSRRVTTIIIGGSAATLGYQVTRATQDIDTWTAVAEELHAAIAKARNATGLNIPFEQSGVADAPQDFEQRLERVLPSLHRLEVLVPEKHDLALMKMIRCYEHDLETIDEIHRNAALELDVLVSRFEQEMGAVIGDPTRLRRNFLIMIERLFPDHIKRVERRLSRSSRKSRKSRST